MQPNYQKAIHWRPAERFMIEVKEYIRQIDSTGQCITLIALDFDNFNYVNDLYGYEIGDRVLEKITAQFDSKLSGEDIFCRLHADHFLICMLTCNTHVAAQTLSQMTALQDVLCDLLPQHYTLAASSGILTVCNSAVPLPALLDRANCARKLSKGAAADTFHIYDEKMNQEAQWKKQVTCMMLAALNNREFEMYLHPKVLLKTGEVVGAEALVRWVSPSYGMIYPDRFIPILEQNGFIQQLDFFMLEEACRFLSEARKKGEPLLPISVNFSRIHLQTDRLVERIFETVNHLGVCTNLIEIEFTENMLSENTQKLIEIVSDLKLLGFRVSLDDFGSAYSSLNYLKDLPIDIVKIDKGFLDSSTDTNRGKIVIAKVVELVKSLRMLCVMEGVETEEQVEFLQKLSCDIGQGYFYARPMPKGDYPSYLQKGNICEELQDYLAVPQPDHPDRSYINAIPQEFQMDNWELYTLCKNIDIGLMKGYLDGDVTVQYVNDCALNYLGYSRQEFREICHNSILAFTHPDDIASVQEKASLLITTGKPMQIEARSLRKDGTVIILRGHASCVIDSHGRPVGIYAFQDVTNEVMSTRLLQQTLQCKIKELKALRLSEECYRLVAEQSDDIMFEWDFIRDQLTFSAKYHLLFGREQHGTTNVTTNPDIRRYIHPQDKELFETWIKETYKMPGYSEGTFRVADVQGQYLRIYCRSTALCDQSGVPIKSVGVFSNIRTQEQLAEDFVVV